jgi:hypothetical protein
MVFGKDDGRIGISVLDPKLSEVTTLIIPADTEVNVARNYGTLRIKNVWQLGINEKLGGRILAETVTQNFLFPVFLWSGESGEAVESPSLANILKFIFLSKNTNIPFGDRLSMGIFTLGVGDIDRSEIDLGKSQFLHKEKLSDGLAGYRLLSFPPERLSIYFSDNEIAPKGPRVYIVDATGKNSVAQKVGQIVEVLGGKIVSVDRKPQPQDSDCQIIGNDSLAVSKIAKLFSCTKTSGKTDFDIELRLGEQFAKRF